MSRRTLSPNERDAAITRLRRGEDVRAVAEALGASPDTVQAIKKGAVRPRENATTEGKPVSARLTPAEIEQLEWVKSHFGYGSNSDAIRALVRAASGMLEFDPVTAEKLTEVKTELHKIGVNVNQIAFAANRGKIDLTRQEWKALDAVRQALPGVRIYLQAVVDEQRRRGIRLFQKFIETGRG